jgi:signal transduction histidine kinase
MALNELGEYIYHENPDSALVLWKQTIKITTENLKKTRDKRSKFTFSSLLARAYLSLGVYNQSRSGPDEALNYFNRSLAINTEINNKEGIGNCLVDIGQVYYRRGDVLQALENYHKGLKIYEKIDSPSSMALCLGNIGNLYVAQDELENGLIYLNRSASMYEKDGNNNGLAFALSGIASMYKDKGDPHCKGLPEECLKKSRERALTIYLKVLDVWSGEENKTGIAKTCRDISSVYLAQGDPAKAFDYAKRALALYELIRNKQGIGTTANMLANIAFDQGNIKSAEAYADKGMAMGKVLGTPHLLQSASTILKKIYIKQNNYKGALEMQELSVKMSDSVNNETTRKASIKKQFELEYTMKAKKDSIVNAINTEKEQFRHEQAIAHQRLYTFGGILGAAFMLIVAVVSFRAFKTKQRANTIITQQSVAIESANKDLQRQHVLNQKIFSVISHDFRGPILSLNLVLNKFKDSSTNEKLNSYLKDIGTSVHNANTVLNNLLNWAKTEIAVESFDKADCLVEEVVKKTEKEFAEKLNEKNLAIVRHIPAGAMIGMPHDILQIAIRNLISNAIKFSNTDSKIEIRFDSNNRSLSVKDFGVGISPEKLAQLFNGQVNAGIGTNKEEGFGIGLYIVSELLYKYGFQIHVESQPNEGTVFKITALN